MINVVATERVSQQELDERLRSKNKPREFVYELTMTRENVVQRQAGAGSMPSQEVRPCTDPAESYREPLTFLRANQRQNFIFSLGNPETLDGRETIVIHFVPAHPAPASVA